MQLLWSRYIFWYFIWSLAFTPVNKYSKNMSYDTCTLNSCDWTTWKTCLYPSRVFSETIILNLIYLIQHHEAGSGLQHRHFRISLYGNLVLHLMSILYWRPVCALKDHVTTVLAKKNGLNCMKFCKFEKSNCKNTLFWDLRRTRRNYVFKRRTRKNYVFKRNITVLFDLYE